jgi:hypothetical protein
MIETEPNTLNYMIESEMNNINESLSVGDTVMSNNPSNASIITTYTDENRAELIKKKEKLNREIDQKTAVIERSERDFSDVHETLPEQHEKKRLHLVEDYTMAVLATSLVFLILVFIYYNVKTSTDMMTGLLKGVGISALFSLFICILIYQLA